MGLLHVVVGALGFASLAVSCFVATRAMRRRGSPTLASLSLLAGFSVVIGFFGGFVVPSLSLGVTGIWIAVVLGWAWLSAMSWTLGRESPNAV